MQSSTEKAASKRISRDNPDETVMLKLSCIRVISARKLRLVILDITSLPIPWLEPSCLR
jgi:hypothetical protein